MPISRAAISRLVYLGCGSLLFLVPLIPFNFIYLPQWGFIAAALRFFPFILVVALLSIVQASGQGPLLARVPLAAWLGTCGLIALAGSITSPLPFQAAGKSLYYFCSGELLVLLVGLAGTSQRTGRLIGWGLGATIAVSLYGLAEVLFQASWLRDAVFNYDNPWMTRYSAVAQNRAIATLGNPIPLGAFLALLSPFFFHLVRIAPSSLVRILAGSGLALVALALYATFSRGAWLAFAVATAVYLWPLPRRYLAIAGGVVLAAGLAAGYSGQLDDRDLVEQLADYRGYNRTRSFEYALAIWSRAPLLGTGTGSYGHLSRPLGYRFDNAENMYLTWLAENGIAGLAVRLGLFAALLRMVHRSWRWAADQAPRGGRPRARPDKARSASPVDRDADQARAFLASFAGFLVNMATWDALYFPALRIVFWILVGLAVAHCRALEEKAENPSTRPLGSPA